MVYEYEYYIFSSIEIGKGRVLYTYIYDVYIPCVRDKLTTSCAVRSTYGVGSVPVINDGSVLFNRFKVSLNFQRGITCREVR